MRILFAQTNYPGFLGGFYAKYSNASSLSYNEIMKRWAKERFGSSNFYSKNIKKYKASGHEIIMNDWASQSRWAEENGIPVSKSEIPFFSYIPESVKNTLGMRTWIKKITFAQVEHIKPDVLYLHDLTVFNTSDIKQLKKKVKLVAGQIACPLPINQSPLLEYGLIVSSFPHYVKMFRRRGIKSEYLRWCIEESIPRDILPKKRIYDIVYVGGLTSSHSTGNKMLEYLTQNFDVDVWGYGETSLAKNSSILKKFHGNAWGNDMYKIFAQAKIVINRHIDVANGYANNMRMFEATGMGAMLITDYKKNMREFFDPDEVVTYKSHPDLERKVSYYLKHDSERAKIARKGQRRTLKEHTYSVRMKELKTIFDKYLA